MADRLARIFGTEEDKVNCPFYFKIGACRHGDTCTRLHNKPLLSQTIIIPHMYENPPASLAIAQGTKVPEEALKEAVRHFEDFYEEVFIELSKYGELEELNVCDNIGDHLIGNVYAKFYREEDSKTALQALNGRYYAGRIIHCEFSPVTDFREARCRQYDDGSCGRGGYCNFMHLKHVSRSFKRSLFRQMYDEYSEYRKRRRERFKNKKDSPEGKHKKSRSSSKSKSGEKDGQEKRKRRSRSRERDRDREKERHKHHHHRHKSRSRSGEMPKTARDKSKSNERDLFRKTSEERRAMIEKWNMEDEAKKQQEAVVE